MFNGTDFKGLEQLVFISVLLSIPASIGIIEFITIPIDILINTKGINYYNRAQINAIFIGSALFTVVPLIYKSLLNCNKRIKEGKVSAKQGIIEYVSLLCIYLLIHLAIAAAAFVLAPPVMLIREKIGIDYAVP